jgi:hypothetical protein
MQENDKVIRASISEMSAPQTEHITARTCMNLSVQHLLSACLFSRQVRALEEQNIGKPFGAFWQDILAHATASMFLSVASLESYVNEVFVHHDTLLPAVRTEILVKRWRTHERKPLLDKVDLALLLVGGGSVDREVRPAQDVVLLIQLRNALIHFKPEWFDEQKEHAKLSDRLAGRFAPSSFFQMGEPIFPRAWATHACTAWAVRSAKEFIKVFENQAGLPKYLALFEARFIYE